MSKTLPANPTKVHLDQGIDDASQARGEIADHVDKFIELKNALGVLALLNLEVDGGLEISALSPGVSDELRVKLEAGRALRSVAAGVGLDIPGLAEVAGLGGTDEFVVWDASAAALRRVKHTNVIGGSASDELVKVSANDTTPNYLVSKLTSDATIARSELNNGGNEQLRVAVAANSIRQGHLSRSSGEVSTGGGSYQGFVLPGGAYGFWPRTKTSQNNTDGDARVAIELGDLTYTARIYMRAVNPGTMFAQQAYITASPPFNFGDGDCQGFIFATVDGGGKITSAYISDVPPWAYNGPTNIDPHEIDPNTGDGYRLVRTRPAVTVADVRAGKADLADLVAARAETKVQRLKVDQRHKNRDMRLIPHPFRNADLVRDGQTVVLLDPLDDRLGELMSLHGEGEEVGCLLCEGKLKVDNEPLVRAGPPGVMQARFRF